MTRPVFTASEVGYELRSDAGCLEWVSGLRDRPKALFHHAKPRWYDDEPMHCPTLGYVCFPDAGHLKGYFLLAFQTNDPQIIEQAMRVQWCRDRFDGEVAA